MGAERGNDDNSDMEGKKRHFLVPFSMNSQFYLHFVSHSCNLFFSYQIHVFTKRDIYKNHDPIHDSMQKKINEI